MSKYSGPGPNGTGWLEIPNPIEGTIRTVSFLPLSNKFLVSAEIDSNMIVFPVQKEDLCRFLVGTKVVILPQEGL